MIEEVLLESSDSDEQINLADWNWMQTDHERIERYE